MAVCESSDVWFQTLRLGANPSGDHIEYQSFICVALKGCLRNK